ncbi:MAG: O-antigen ligase family protein [Candidatus Portnoybacteria bacterium]
MYKWLLLLIFYLPFQIALNPPGGFDLASIRVFILILFVFWLVKIRKFFFNNLQAPGLFFFLILAGISLLGAQNPLWGARKIAYFLSVFPLYFLVVNLANSLEKTKKIISVLVNGGIIIALIGFLQFLSQFIFGLERVYGFWAVNILPIFSGFNLGALIMAYPSWLVNVSGQTIMRAFSLFSDPHMFSFYLGLILPLGIVLSIKKNKKLLFTCLNVCMFMCLLLSFTRGAYLALISSFLVLAFLFWKYLGNRKIALLLFVSLLIFVVPGTAISDRFYSTFNLSEGSNAGRLEMWQEASRIGLNNFWQGVGLGNYSSIINTDFGYRNPITAHNLYLDIFSEMGFFALAVWLLLILGTIGHLFDRIREMKDNTERKYLLVGLIGSLVYLSVHSFFETPLYSPVVLAVLMIVLGLSTICLKKSSDSESI